MLADGLDARVRDGVEGDLALGVGLAGGDGLAALLDGELEAGEVHGLGLALDRLRAGEDQLAGGGVGVGEVHGVDPGGAVLGRGRDEPALAVVGDVDLDGDGRGGVGDAGLGGAGVLGDLVGVLADGLDARVRDGVEGDLALGVGLAGGDGLAALLDGELEAGEVHGLGLALDLLRAGEDQLAGGGVGVGEAGNNNVVARLTRRNINGNDARRRVGERRLARTTSNFLNGVLSRLKLFNELSARNTISNSQLNRLFWIASCALTLVDLKLVSTISKILEACRRLFGNRLTGDGDILGDLERTHLLLTVFEFADFEYFFVSGTSILNLLAVSRYFKSYLLASAALLRRGCFNHDFNVFRFVLNAIFDKTASSLLLL